MRNITIDDVIDYIIIVLSDDDIQYELTDSELSIFIDLVRDRRLPMYELDCYFASLREPTIPNRKNLSKSKEEEMSDICKLLNYKVKYQPKRITKSLLNKKK